MSKAKGKDDIQNYLKNKLAENSPKELASYKNLNINPKNDMPSASQYGKAILSTPGAAVNSVKAIFDGLLGGKFDFKDRLKYGKSAAEVQAERQNAQNIVTQDKAQIGENQASAYSTANNPNLGESQITPTQEKEGTI